MLLKLGSMGLVVGPELAGSNGKLPGFLHCAKA